MKRALFALGVIFSLVNAAWALNYSWFNFSGTAGNWNDPTNWVLTDGTYNGLVPGPGDMVYTRGASDDWALVDPSVTTADLVPNREWGYELGGTSPQLVRTAESWYNWTPQTITINPADNITISGFRGGNTGHLSNTFMNIYGTLTSTGSTFDVARYHYSSVEFNQYDGSTVNINGSNGLRVGYKSYRAIYNIYGGTLNTTKLTIPDGSNGYAMSDNVGAYPTANHEQPYTMAKAEMNIYGGTVYVGSGGFNINNLSSPTGKINITQGTLCVLGIGPMFFLKPLIDNGFLVAYGGTGTIQYAFDGTYTVITANPIPEPASLAVLALGSLVFMRRRK